MIKNIEINKYTILGMDNKKLNIGGIGTLALLSNSLKSSCVVMIIRAIVTAPIIPRINKIKFATLVIFIPVVDLVLFINFPPFSANGELS